MKENAELFDWSVNVRINKDGHGHVITGTIGISEIGMKKWDWEDDELADVDRKSVEDLIGLAGHVMTRKEKNYVHLKSENKKVGYSVGSIENDKATSTTVYFKCKDRCGLTQELSVPWEEVDEFRKALSLLGSEMDEAEALFKKEGGAL